MKSVEIHEAVRKIPDLSETEAHKIANMLERIDELATKDDLKVAVSGLRTEMADLRTEVRTEMASKADLKEGLASLEKHMMTHINWQLYKFAFFIVLTTVVLTEGVRAF